MRSTDEYLLLWQGLSLCISTLSITIKISVLHVLNTLKNSCRNWWLKWVDWSHMRPVVGVKCCLTVLLEIPLWSQTHVSRWRLVKSYITYKTLSTLKQTCSLAHQTSRNAIFELKKLPTLKLSTETRIKLKYG